MDIDIIKIKFVFTDQSILEINDKPFRKAIESVIKSKITFNNQPLKILFPTTKKILYFDKKAFYAYVEKEITQIELIEKTQCEGLYRNTQPLSTTSDDSIDYGALWKKIGKELYLVDSDVPILSQFDENLFKEV